jgi:hypothetical protein
VRVRRGPDFRATNGELVTVSKIDEQRRIHLQDGRALPENYKQFTHGYAVTAHRSQGKSVDAVVISANGMRKELFYAAASRGRKSITVVTSDKELLRETIARSEARQSASELSRKTQGPALEEKEQSQTLRQQNLRDLPPANKQHHDVAQDAAGLSRNAPPDKTEQTITQENPVGRQKQEHIIEPRHYLGISL